MTNWDKILGCAFGAMCGDALGAPLEFKNYPFKQGGKIVPGMIREMLNGDALDGRGNYTLKAGSFTDDSEMSLCIIDAYLKAKTVELKSSQVIDEFLSWYNNGPEDVGIYTGTVLESFKSSKNWREAVMHAYYSNPIKSAANGCVMRCWATSVACAVRHDTVAKIKFFNDGVSQAVATHLNAYAIYGSVFVNLVHYFLFQGKQKKEAIFLALNDPLLIDKLPADFAEQIANVTKHPPTFQQLVARNENTGWVVHTVLNAVAAFLATNTLEDAIVYAANLGQDADTTASVAGGIAGAYYGYNNIPKRWLNKLNGKWPIKSGNNMSTKQLFAKMQDLKK